MKIINLFLMIFFVGIVGGCSSVLEPNAGLICDSDCQQPSPANGFYGKFVLRWDAKNDMAAANNIAQKYCAGYNGIKTPPSAYIRYSNLVKYSFQCNGYTAPLPPVQQIVQPQNQTIIPPNDNSKLKSQVEEAKLKCAELGFKSNTEAFGKCVLKLAN